MEGLDRNRPVSLYIHIPFCRRKCDYCAFYSRPPREDQEIERYFRILLQEVNAVVDEVGMPFKTIFVGGGNPGILGYERLHALIAAASRLGKTEETTIEINPENLTEEVLSLYPLVDRISVGIQSMKDETLKTLGRNARSTDNRKALALLSSSPFRWNADIITAVPGESVEDTLSDIEEVASYHPEHISFYCLTFEEGTPLSERMVPLGQDKEAEFLAKGWEKLEALGYEHYEISNFAREKRYSKHNMVYWELGQYVGVGPSAESLLGYSKTVSMRNTECLEEYFESPSFTCDRLNPVETEESYLLTVLRTKFGISKKEYAERFRQDFDEVYGSSIVTLDSSWYEDTDDRFCLTPNGMLRLDAIILTLAMSI